MLGSVISDGSHGGNKHFYFLPPLVSPPAFSGTFDGTLSPVVEICELVGATCGPVVASFSGPQVTVDPVAEAYQAVWQTKLSGLDNSKTYRIQVLLAGFLIGFADADIVANSKAASTVDTANLVAVKNGSLVPIRFRIEEGVLKGFFTSVSAGGTHTCGLTPIGEAYCWGHNFNGELGDGSLGTSSDTPVPVSGGHVFQSISAGGTHACGLAFGGDAYCWGNNWSGQLGDGNHGTQTHIDVASDIPVLVGGGHAFQSISAGSDHTCAVADGGEAYCWGNISCHDGSPAFTPVLVCGGHAFQSISAGGGHACGVTSGGDAYCWGENDYGELGNGNAPTTSLIPILVGNSFLSISAGYGHTCGFIPGGKTYCWGLNDYGALGDGNAPTDIDTPVLVLGGLAFQSTSAGNLSSCALTPSGDAYCWGSNYSGQLGDGNTGTDSDVPVPVIGGHSLQSISAGGGHTCGVNAIGKALCWGNNDFGQLGDGNAPTSSDSPVEVAFQ